LLSIKVEKNETETDNNQWFEIIPVIIDNNEFKDDIEFLNSGDIIGIKGRIRKRNEKIILFCEKLQNFCIDNYKISVNNQS
jgi:lysyl-tRNA synthetase class II